MDSSDVIVYGLLVLAILAAAFVWLQPSQPAPSAAPKEIQPGFMKLAQQAGTGEIPDKCKAPPGTDEAQWKQHLSHHPDQYGDCPQ
ncbi:MAG: hypothetical protein J4203_02115 [Candidatus Diapherotrites archaeon]|uniref:Uncharacterized protein n=1 Tax=Candidatus Iainarchaeum sp. TaxID=3101447 RepID=A0A8T4L5T5_9ARCH|nr:hypothetical protein [Candidatus Diapherotrites archaeon]